MNPIEKAYKAWRATVTDNWSHVSWRAGTPSLYTPGILTTNDKPRKYAGTGRYKRTAAPYRNPLSAPNPITPRDAILDVLRAKGPMSKAEIIERAGLTPGRKSVPHFSGLLRTKTIRKVGDRVALAKVR